MLRSMAFSPDGSALALGGMQHSVFTVQVASGCTVELEGHSAPVAALAFTADGSWLVSASRAMLMVYDASEFMQGAEPPMSPLILNHAGDV
jgi:WD40 repeat protein